MVGIALVAEYDRHWSKVNSCILFERVLFFYFYFYFLGLKLKVWFNSNLRYSFEQNNFYELDLPWLIIFCLLYLPSLFFMSFVFFFFFKCTEISPWATFFFFLIYVYFIYCGFLTSVFLNCIHVSHTFFEWEILMGVAFVEWCIFF